MSEERVPVDARPNGVGTLSALRRACVGGLAGLVAAVALAGCGPDEPTRQVTVRAVVRPERSICEDPSGTDLEGATFTVTDGEGATLDEGKLGAATLDGYNRVSTCSFYGEADVPDRGSYSVRLEEGQEVTYSKRALEEVGWVFLMPEEQL